MGQAWPFLSLIPDRLYVWLGRAARRNKQQNALLKLHSKRFVFSAFTVLSEYYLELTCYKEDENQKIDLINVAR